MYSRFLAALVLCFAISSSALANRSALISRYINAISKKTGKTENEVRQILVDSLSLSGRFSLKDLHRINTGRDLSRLKNSELLRYLRTDRNFREAVGLSAIRHTFVPDHVITVESDGISLTKPITYTADPIYLVDPALNAGITGVAPVVLKRVLKTSPFPQKTADAIVSINVKHVMNLTVGFGAEIYEVVLNFKNRAVIYTVETSNNNGHRTFEIVPNFKD